MSERAPQPSQESTAGSTPAWFDPTAVIVAPLSAEEEATARQERAPLPTWPVVVGVVSLILGLASAGLNASIFAMPALFEQVDRLGYLDLSAETALPSLEPTASAKANAAAKIGVGLLLASAGALTLARRRLGAWMHIVYGGLGVIVIAWGAWEGAQQRAALAEWASEHPDAIASRFVAQPSLAWTAISAGVALAWPVFALLWFGSLGKHRNELRGRS